MPDKNRTPFPPQSPLLAPIHSAATAANGQLGYAVDRFLPHVTGGVAFINYEGAAATSPGGIIIAGSEYNETKAGWTVGAGLAYAITDNLVANIDYRYSDFGSSTFNTPPVAQGQTSVDIKESAVKFGFSYRF
jgi:outer membrane immunogenic protein